MPETKVAIIGVGLIGGSLGMALRRAGGFRVTGVGRHEKKLRLAKKLGAVDDLAIDLARGVRDADIVVLCTPVDVTAATVAKILPHIKDGAVLTDAGSIKGGVHRALEPILKNFRAKTGKKIYFVGGHPMAGAEKSGVAFADGRIYRGASVVISVEPGAPARAGDTVRRMWRKAGARLMDISPAEHDRMVAFASHLPHVLAFALCRAVFSASRCDPRTKEVLASSFRDMTRVADSNPRDWAVICSGNKKELVRAIDRCIRELKTLRDGTGNSARLEKAFSEAKSARQKLLHT